MDISIADLNNKSLISLLKAFFNTGDEADD